jgi:hypothetical protein
MKNLPDRRSTDNQTDPPDPLVSFSLAPRSRPESSC